MFPITYSSYEATPLMKQSVETGNWQSSLQVFFFIHLLSTFHPITKFSKFNSQTSLKSPLSLLYYHFHIQGLIFSCTNYLLTKSAFPASNVGHFKPNLHTISKMIFLKFKFDHVTLNHEILKVFL